MGILYFRGQPYSHSLRDLVPCPPPTRSGAAQLSFQPGSRASFYWQRKRGSNRCVCFKTHCAPLIPSAASAQNPESQVLFEIKHHCVLSLGRVTARPHLPLSLFLEVRLGDGKSLPRTMDFACQAPGGSSSERKGKGATEIEFRLVRGNRVEKAPQTCELQLFPAPREWRWFSWRDAGDHHMRSSEAII